MADNIVENSPVDEKNVATDDNTPDLSDGGLTSRKFILTIFVLVLLAAAYLAIARWPILASSYAILGGFLLGGAGIYHGSNIASKHVIGNIANKANQ